MANMAVEITDKQLAAAIRAAEVQNFLPNLIYEVDKLQAMVDTKAYGAIVAGTMTGEMALNLWMEKLAYKNLLKRFDSRAKAV